PRRALDYQLHDPDVIQDGEQRADEDHRGQDLKGKVKTQMRSLFAEIAKNKLRSGKRIAEKAIHGVASLLEKRAADFNLKNKKGEDKLPAEAPAHGLQADRLPVGRKDVAERQHRNQAENAGKSSHLVLSFMNHAMNQRRPVSQRRGRNCVAFFQQLAGACSLRVGVTMNRAQRFAGGNLVANLLMDDNADGGINGILFLLASAPKNHARRSNLFAFDRGNISRARAGYIYAMIGGRKACRIVNHANVAALQLNHLPEAIKSFARGDDFVGLLFAFSNCLRR